MWSSNHDNHFAAKGFSTPPAYWKRPPSLAVMPMTERKINVRCDLFHVVHKVPSGDSPYVRAKHVQLIDKDPSKAISLFWAAINAGDRVDSALKDMAAVMKQLDRPDEAIEAIKSFRHLCSLESQESLDNVLVELYKRSGRIEEEIEMLHRKLNNIEQGIAFGGKRTKIARSQGKKIQITVEQETSRILGNLAWAYLQHHDYGLAENFYRKSLALEADNNKQCNLAICLMNMNRIPEAKSLLQAVKASCGNKEMDDSFAKSFERAVEMLTEIDSKTVLKPTGDDDWRKLNGSKCLSSVQSSISSNKMQEHHAAVLYTQPREASWRSFEGDETRRRYKEDEKVTVHTIRNLDGELLHSTAEKSDSAASKSKSSNMVSPHDERNSREWSRTVAARTGGGGAMVEPFSQPRIERHSNQMISGSKDQILVSDVNVSGKVESTYTAGGKKKSWADMAEEDEDLSPCFNDWKEEECNNENLDSNYQSSYAESPTETISQRLEALDLKDNSNCSDGTPTRNQSVRRCLCFNGKKDLNIMKKNRLQVFRDITPSQDSP